MEWEVYRKSETPLPKPGFEVSLNMFVDQQEGSFPGKVCRKEWQTVRMREISKLCKNIFNEQFLILFSGQSTQKDTYIHIFLVYSLLPASPITKRGIL